MMTERSHIIWLVEDEQVYADSLIYILNNISGLQCKKHFPSAEDLQKYLASPRYAQSPDLVLMDILLPGKSGIEAVRQLRNQLPGVPIVMLTFNDDRAHIIEAMSAGAAGYIVKGDSLDQMVEVIRQAIDGRLLLSEAVTAKFLGHIRSKEPKDFGLTRRQFEVLGLMCKGLNKTEIADRLAISLSTADNHFRHIYQKLGVNSAQAAVATAFRERLIQPERE